MKIPRVTKGMITAANRELACIWQFATEQGNPDGSCLCYHAQSASNCIATLVKAGQPLPDFALRNVPYLKALGWRFDLHGFYA